MSGKAMAWSGGIVAAAASGGLIWYFGRVGWERASWVAGVAGLFVAVAGLAVTIWGLVLQQRADAGGQHVAANVSGSVTLVRGADGNVKIKNSSSTIAPPAGAAPAPYAPAAGNQSVTGSISGPVNLIDGAKDVELE
ncbi:hypothetical protein ABZS81_30495 [Streptomyces sp. NPDC005318]|uniref:hypothetical protein n=1 Tax=Streptomyces sp. NPDC005318 TaxID=3157031 RepID=UPI00339F6869